MIDLDFSAYEHVLRFRLDQKLLADSGSWQTIGPFEIVVGCGESVELVLPDDRSLEAVLNILTLQDLNWIGLLTFGGNSVRGLEEIPPEYRPWLFTGSPIHRHGRAGDLLRAHAKRTGWSDAAAEAPLRRLAARYELLECLDTPLFQLSRLERQGLQCAMLEMARPAYVVIDGRERIYPALRHAASHLFRKIGASSAVVVVGLGGSRSWNGLASVRVHPPMTRTGVPVVSEPSHEACRF